MDDHVNNNPKEISVSVYYGSILNVRPQNREKIKYFW